MSKIEQLKSERDQVVAEFEAFRKERADAINAKIEEAGLSGFIRQANAEIEAERQKGQSRVDFLTGQITVLEELETKAEPAAIEAAEA
jgi:hypothetical protein